jgi:hypothetical protein
VALPWLAVPDGDVDAMTEPCTGEAAAWALGGLGPAASGGSPMRRGKLRTARKAHRMRTEVRAARLPIIRLALTAIYQSTVQPRTLLPFLTDALVIFGDDGVQGFPHFVANVFEEAVFCLVCIVCALLCIGNPLREQANIQRQHNHC